MTDKEQKFLTFLIDAKQDEEASAKNFLNEGSKESVLEAYACLETAASIDYIIDQFKSYFDTGYFWHETPVASGGCDNK